MGLALSDLNTRLQDLVQDSSSASDAQRVRALADADVELSSIKGYWRVRSHDYTSSSSPAMTAGSNQLTVPSSPAFEAPYRMYYRESGYVREVKFKSKSEWLELSNLSLSDYPRWACLVQTASSQRIDLDRLLSSDFVNSIGTLTLDYFIGITRLSASGDESILPDSLREHIVPIAARKFALSQGDRNLANDLKEDAERAREAVLRWDIEHISRPRQIRTSGAYSPSDLTLGVGDYQE